MAPKRGPTSTRSRAPTRAGKTARADEVKEAKGRLSAASKKQLDSSDARAPNQARARTQTRTSRAKATSAPAVEGDVYSISGSDEDEAPKTRKARSRVRTSNVARKGSRTGKSARKSRDADMEATGSDESATTSTGDEKPSGGANRRSRSSRGVQSGQTPFGQTPTEGDSRIDEDIDAIGRNAKVTAEAALDAIVSSGDAGINHRAKDDTEAVEERVPESSAQSPPRGRGRGRTSMFAPPARGTSLTGADVSELLKRGFKKQRREQSIIAGFRSQLQEQEQQEDSTFDSTGFGLDTTLTISPPGFAPQIEGTPLASPRQNQNVRESLSHENEDLYAMSPSPRGRKRKSSEISGAAAHQPDLTQLGVDGEGEDIEVPRTQPAASAGPSSDLSSIRSSPPLPVDIRARSDSTPHSADVDADVLADPLSSSPTTSPLSSPAKPVSSAPPRRAKDTAVTTAALRALLPRRQTRPQKDSYEISSTTSSSDEREATFARPRRALADAGSRKNARPTTTSGNKGKPASRRTVAVAAGKENAPQHQAGRLAKPKHADNKTLKKGRGGGARSYARRRARVESDDDDQSGDDVGESKELLAAREKFRAIDRADLEFESASLGGGSSPWR